METSRTVARPYRGLPTLSAGHPRPAGWLHPRFQRLPPPVIVMGMHRSGTSLVAGMLGALGVYVGPEFGAAGADLIAAARDGRQSGYAEAAAFFRLNELLLRAARCSWCRVEPFLRRRRQPAWAGAAELLLRVHTGRSLLRDFLQPLPETYQGAWGWKDPRNSLTLPLWRRLFPEARVIHVLRDPEAVARSLHQRAVYCSQTGGAAGSRSPCSPLREAARRLRLLAPLLPDPCLDLDYCRELSRIYRTECTRVAEEVPAVLEVHYEEIMASPELAARRLAGFAGVDQRVETLRRAGALVLQER